MPHPGHGAHVAGGGGEGEGVGEGGGGEGEVGGVGGEEGAQLEGGLGQQGPHKLHAVVHGALQADGARLHLTAEMSLTLCDPGGRICSVWPKFRF